MEEGRNFFIRKKAILVLDKRFPVSAKLNAGDSGQLILTGRIEAERVVEEEDYNEKHYKTIKISSIEVINNKERSRI